MNRCRGLFIKILLLVAVWGLAAIPAHGQEAKLDLSHLDGLAAKASQVVDITVDQKVINLALKFLSEKRSADEAKIKEIISGLKGVYIKSFEFEKDGEYTQSDIESIRNQLKTPAWARIVGVTSRKSENVEVYLGTTGDRVDGVVVIAADPKQFTVIDVVGSIDPEKIRELEGHLGFPKLDLIFKKHGKE
jgi:hypothetical protein